MGGRRAQTVAALVLCLCAARTAAETTELVLKAPGAIRDVIVDPGSSTVYLASYDTDEVLCLDPSSRELVARVQTGNGPSALAASDGWIAVLNRHDGSLNIIRASSRTVHGTVELGPGATTVFDASNGNFGVVDPFEQSISLVNSESAAVRQGTKFDRGVPVSGVHAGDRLAILTRSPDEIQLMDSESLATVERVAIPPGVRRLCALSADVVAVATDHQIVTVELASGRVLDQVAVEAAEIERASGGLVSISQSAGVTYGWDGSRLNATTHWSMPPDTSRALEWSGGQLVWTPGGKAVWAVDPSSPVRVIQTATATRTQEEFPRRQSPQSVDVLPAPTTVMQQTAVPSVTSPVPRNFGRILVPTANPPKPLAALSPDAKPAPPADTYAVAQADEDPDEQSGARSDPVFDSVSEDAPGADEAREPAVDVEYADRFSVAPRRTGIGAKSPYPPFFGDPSGSFRAALEDALSIRSDSASLLAVDWSQSPEDIESPLGSLRLLNGRIEANQPTSFRIGDTTVRANTMSLSTVGNEIELLGDVRLERPGAFLTADSLRIVDPPVSQEGFLSPLVPQREYRGVAHPLLPHGKTEDDYAPQESRGTLVAENVVWNEAGVRELVADELQIDLGTRGGVLTNAQGHAGPLYFGAQELIVEGPWNLYAEDLWVTTCDLPEPHYRLRLANARIETDQQVTARHARLQIGNTTTPIYVPYATASLAPGERRRATEIDFGTRSELGGYLNVAQWFAATEHSDLAPRVYATTGEGVGFGLDGQYDLMNAPAATFFRSEGEFQGLYTTEDRGYGQAYHRQELTLNSVALAQVEYWSDSEFLKDFYPGDYSDRTGPRTFANVTRTRPSYITSATVAPSINSFTTETEKLPDVSFSLMERPATGNLYGTFDAVAGYYRTEPGDIESERTVAVGRLSYDWNVASGFNILPFIEVDGTFYSRMLDDDSALRGSATGGVTVQGRLQRAYDGVANFSGFKHVIVPSATLLYRPEPTVEADEVPRFDDLDDRPARFRLEGMIDNIVLARNASTNTIWPVARLTLYAGNDFYNEEAEAADYEVELEIRPRPWWGIYGIGEIHDLKGGDATSGEDLNRALAYIFFDNETTRNNINARIGFAYTEPAGEIENQEIFYGMGYKLSENWSAAFEQRYDFNLNEFSRQTYAIRRRLHKWEMELFVRDRQSGVDFGFRINLTDLRDIGFGA